MEHISKLLILLAFCLLACARQGAPTGGAKDTTPPGIDTLGSSPNFVTRANPKRITVKFDEWVVLSDAATQVVVSPPLEKRPVVTLRGKTLLLKFDEAEKFRENTTYTINFGSSVKDLHEGNPAKDLRFVFSTGDFIDSLTNKGRVVDALTGDPLDNISVMLYDDLTDSVVRKERPYYFSRTDKSGLYEIRNVKAGRYKLAAMEDLDQNLRWDGENDRIGFLDSTILIQDSMKGLVVLQLFKNPSKFRLTEKNINAFGVLRFKFSGSVDSAIVRPEAISGLKTLLEKTQDSMLLWYDLEPDGPWQVFVNQDTVTVKALSREVFLTNHSLLFSSDIPNASSRKLQQEAPQLAPPIRGIQIRPTKPAVFEFNYPIMSVDTTKWQLVMDSLPAYDFFLKTDSLAPRKCTLAHQWLPGKSYSLELLPGALRDFWGQTNGDTLRRTINIPGEKLLGGLNLTINNLRLGRPYIVELLEGARVIETQAFEAETNDKKLVFSGLNPGTYTARLIEDLNKNGRWDTGDYWAHRQPEAVVSKKLEALRANWELEAQISLNTDGIEKKKKK